MSDSKQLWQKVIFQLKKEVLYCQNELDNLKRKRSEIINDYRIGDDKNVQKRRMYEINIKITYREKKKNDYLKKIEDCKQRMKVIV